MKQKKKALRAFQFQIKIKKSTIRNKSKSDSDLNENLFDANLVVPDFRFSIVCCNVAQKHHLVISRSFRTLTKK